MVEVNSRNYEAIIQKRILDRLRRLDPRQGKIRDTLWRIGNLMEAQAKLNITKVGGPDRHPLNPAGGGEKNLVDSGNLRSRVKAQPPTQRGNITEVIVGVFGVPYAAIHEFGGTIKPTGGRKFISIPIVPEFRGQNPKDVFQEEDLYFYRSKNGKFFLARKLRSGRQQFVYRLLPRANIPARPYFFPALTQIKPQALQMIRNLFSTGN